MLRNKIGALLIALQIAFTLIVCVNSFAMIEDRLALIDRPSGLVEDALFHLASTGIGADFNALVEGADDLRMLRSTPGIVNAVQLNAIPLSGSGWSMGLQVQPGDDIEGESVAVYMVDEQGINTFGVELIAGANFVAAEVGVRSIADSDWPQQVILTAATVEALFPELPIEAVVGKTVYIANHEPMTIKGVIRHLQAPWNGANFVAQSILVPQRLDFVSSQYMVRTEPGRRDEMIPLVEAALAQRLEARLLQNVRSMAETRERSYAVDNGLARVLQFVMAVLLLITGCGILGLASFSVRRRTKQIGTRRALGATSGDILRYFLVENFLITAGGVVLGAILTVLANVWLVETLGFPKLNWLYLPIGMLGLLLIGQLAAFGPARRAGRISPALATRTV
jgi:putative ABC transport system permease protein